MSRNAFQSLESRPLVRSDDLLPGDRELFLLRLSKSLEDDERCREDRRELRLSLEYLDMGLFGSS
jgi:hypothetical protein